MPDQFLPREGTVPANLAAVAWWSGNDWAPSDSDAGTGDHIVTTAEELIFECRDAEGATRTISFEVEHAAYAFIRPTIPLTPAERCELRSRVVDCDLSRVEFEFWSGGDRRYLSGAASFEVGPNAPLPKSLGRLVSQPPVVEPIELSEGGGCSAIDEVCSIELSIEFDDEARPWKDAFVYETWVDGKQWRVSRAAPLPPERGGSYLGRGREILFAHKEGVRRQSDSAGLSPGRHTVEIRATLAGTDVAVVTESAEVDLDCFAEPIRDAGTSESDADVAIVDAGPRDAGQTDSSGRASSPRKRSSSCSVALPGRAPAPVFELAWTLAALAFCRRRLRRS